MENNDRETERMKIHANMEVEKHKASEERRTQERIAQQEGETKRQALREPTKRRTLYCLTAAAILTVGALTFAIWQQPSCVEQIIVGLVHTLLVLVGAIAATASSILPQRK